MTDERCPLCGRQMHLRWDWAAGHAVWWCDTPRWSPRTDTGTACQQHGAMREYKPTEDSDALSKM